MKNNITKKLLKEDKKQNIAVASSEIDNKQKEKKLVNPKNQEKTVNVAKSKSETTSENKNIVGASTEIDKKQKEQKLVIPKNQEKTINVAKGKPEPTSKSIKSSGKNAEVIPSKVIASVSNKKDLGNKGKTPVNQNLENELKSDAPLVEPGKSTMVKKTGGNVSGKLVGKVAANTETTLQNAAQKSVKTVEANKKSEPSKKVTTKEVTSSNKQVVEGKSAEEVKPSTTAPARPAMRGGKGKRRRGKPRISPAELRRRQIREWVKVGNAIFGQSLYMQPPSMPYFLHKEKEILARRDRVLQERRFKSVQQRTLARKVATSTRHNREVRHRQRQVILRHQRWARKAAEHVEQRIADLESNRMRSKLEHQRRMYRQQMQEIKEAEQRKRQDKRNRRDEDRVTRILTAKYGSF